MPVDATTVSLKSIPLFADLDESTLEDFHRIFRAVSFTQGTYLMTQGQVADSIFFLESGAVEVVTSLPGGGELVVTTLGPGSVIGEMALLDDIGTRTATVRALVPTSGFVVERQDCRVLLMQSQRTAFTVQRRITLSLCQRLRELRTMILSLQTPNARHSSVSPENLALLPATGHNRPSTLAYRTFLPYLPFFLNFRADEVEQFLEQAVVLELPRGDILFRQGEPGQASYIIVRGAVELVSNTAARYSLGVLGPGQICGQIALIDGAPHETTAVVRSRAVLLMLSQPAFAHLFTTTTRVAAKFQNAILQSLLLAQAKADNHLTRLMSQAYIRAHPGKETDEKIAQVP